MEEINVRKSNDSIRLERNLCCMWDQIKNHNEEESEEISYANQENGWETNNFKIGVIEMVR